MPPVSRRESHGTSWDASWSRAPREPVKKPPVTSGPRRASWPDKVAIVSYGFFKPYVGPVNLYNYEEENWVSVDGPAGLAEWAAANQAGHANFLV